MNDYISPSETSEQTSEFDSDAEKVIGYTLRGKNDNNRSWAKPDEKIPKSKKIIGMIVEKKEDDGARTRRWKKTKK